jgi:LPXTG-motif cell wall-anchored protein
VASPGAAGSSTSLPATGFFAIALFAIGFGLVGGGSYLKRLEQRLTSSAS